MLEKKTILLADANDTARAGLKRNLEKENALVLKRQMEKQPWNYSQNTAKKST